MCNLNEIYPKLLFDKVPNVLVLNAPEHFVFDIKSEEEEAGSGMLYFCYSVQDINEFVAKVGGALKQDIVLWMAYPKTTGSIQSDITRDKGWEAFDTIQLKPVTQVSIDKDWSALRFKPAHLVQSEKVFSPHIDYDTRIVSLPFDLSAVLDKEETSFFEALSFTNQKEYVEWIDSAKKPETRKSRIEKTKSKLANKVKNPH